MVTGRVDEIDDSGTDWRSTRVSADAGEPPTSRSTPARTPPVARAASRRTGAPTLMFEVVGGPSRVRLLAYGTPVLPADRRGTCVMRRSAPRAHRTVGRVVAAVALTVLALLVPSGVASAATAGDTASATVTLDTPGTLTLDAVDPDSARSPPSRCRCGPTCWSRCASRTPGKAPGSMAAGTATGTLDAEFPGGASQTATSVDAVHRARRPRPQQRHRRLRRRLRRLHRSFPRPGHCRRHGLLRANRPNHHTTPP